jgi:hypothetical protein
MNSWQLPYTFPPKPGLATTSLGTIKIALLPQRYCYNTDVTVTKHFLRSVYGRLTGTCNIICLPTSTHSYHAWLSRQEIAFLDDCCLSRTLHVAVLLQTTWGSGDNGRPTSMPKLTAGLHVKKIPVTFKNYLCAILFYLFIRQYELNDNKLLLTLLLWCHIWKVIYDKTFKLFTHTHTPK